MRLEELGLRIPEGASKDPETVELLATLGELLEGNPLLGYNNPDLKSFGGKVHEKQYEFNLIQLPPLGIKAAIAANRAGKTMGCRADDTVQLVPREFVPEHLIPCKKWEPPCHIWVGAPKYAKHEDTTVPIFRKLIPKAALWKGSFEKAYSSQSRMIRLECGSTIGLKTYDQDLDAWASAEIHRISWDEEPNTPNSAEMRSEARARLISTGGEEIIGMTPLLGYSWAHDDVWMRRGEEGIHVVTMTMEDNPWNPPAVIKEYAAGLTEEERRMRLKGEFVHVGGLVYPNLRSEHFVSPPTREHVRSQTAYIGIDPGVRTTAVVFVAFDNDNCALVFDELYLHDNDAIPENAAKAIKEKISRWGIDPRFFLIDPSARNRSLTDAQKVQQLYKLAGLNVFPAQNDVETGVFEVKRRLEFELLYISDDCKKLRWELERYRVDPKADGRFAVLKQDDHGCFAAGTHVETERGCVPIEQVTLADRVLTREGYFPVECVAKTQGSAEVYRLLYEGGELIGTGDHPIWVGNEFRRLDSLRYGDILTAWQRPLNTQGSGGDGTPKQLTAQTASTSGPRATATCTAGSGKRTTGLSPVDTTFTTSTGTPSTTSLRTSLVSRLSNTLGNIGRLSGRKPPQNECSASTSTPARRPVRVLALEKLPETRAVFNLKVDGPSEYFANCVLVSNCDALRYVCMARPVAPHTRKGPPLPRRNEWVPGTAPAYEPRPQREVSPMGLFS